MSMVSPETIKLLMMSLNGEPQNGPFVMVDRTVLRGVLAEIQQLQGTINALETQRHDLVQKMTLEFSMHSVADSLHCLSYQNWGDLTPGEVLEIAAQRIRKSAEEIAVPGAAA